jgi:hypothetical protein
VNAGPFVFVVMALAILNGIFSPFFVVTGRIIVTHLAPALLIASPQLLAFIASLLASTVTIIVSGIPQLFSKERPDGGRRTPLRMLSGLSRRR